MFSESDNGVIQVSINDIGNEINKAGKLYTTVANLEEENKKLTDKCDLYKNKFVNANKIIRSLRACVVPNSKYMNLQEKYNKKKAEFDRWINQHQQENQSRNSKLVTLEKQNEKLEAENKVLKNQKKESPKHKKNGHLDTILKLELEKDELQQNINSFEELKKDLETAKSDNSGLKLTNQQLKSNIQSLTIDFESFKLKNIELTKLNESYCKQITKFSEENERYKCEIEDLKTRYEVFFSDINMCDPNELLGNTVEVVVSDFTDSFMTQQEQQSKEDLTNGICETQLIPIDTLNEQVYQYEIVNETSDLCDQLKEEELDDPIQEDRTTESIDLVDKLPTVELHLSEKSDDDTSSIVVEEALNYFKGIRRNFISPLNPETKTIRPRSVEKETMKIEPGKEYSPETQYVNTNEQAQEQCNLQFMTKEMSSVKNENYSELKEKIKCNAHKDCCEPLNLQFQNLYELMVTQFAKGELNVIKEVIKAHELTLASLKNDIQELQTQALTWSMKSVQAHQELQTVKDELKQTSKELKEMESRLFDGNRLINQREQLKKRKSSRLLRQLYQFLKEVQIKKKKRLQTQQRISKVKNSSQWRKNQQLFKQKALGRHQQEANKLTRQPSTVTNNLPNGEDLKYTNNLSCQPSTLTCNELNQEELKQVNKLTLQPSNFTQNLWNEFQLKYNSNLARQASNLYHNGFAEDELTHTNKLHHQPSTLTDNGLKEEKLKPTNKLAHQPKSIKAQEKATSSYILNDDGFKGFDVFEPADICCKLFAGPNSIISIYNNKLNYKKLQLVDNFSNAHLMLPNVESEDSTNFKSPTKSCVLSSSKQTTVNIESDCKEFSQQNGEPSIKKRPLNKLVTKHKDTNEIAKKRKINELFGSEPVEQPSLQEIPMQTNKLSDNEHETSDLSNNNISLHSKKYAINKHHNRSEELKSMSDRKSRMKKKLRKSNDSEDVSYKNTAIIQEGLGDLSELNCDKYEDIISSLSEEDDNDEFKEIISPLPQDAKSSTPNTGVHSNKLSSCLNTKVDVSSSPDLDYSFTTQKKKRIAHDGKRSVKENSPALVASRRSHRIRDLPPRNFLFKEAYKRPLCREINKTSVTLLQTNVDNQNDDFHGFLDSSKTPEKAKIVSNVNNQIGVCENNNYASLTLGSKVGNQVNVRNELPASSKMPEEATTDLNVNNDTSLALQINVDNQLNDFDELPTSSKIPEEATTDLNVNNDTSLALQINVDNQINDLDELPASSEMPEEAKTDFNNQIIIFDEPPASPEMSNVSEAEVNSNNQVLYDQSLASPDMQNVLECVLLSWEHDIEDLKVKTPVAKVPNYPKLNKKDLTKMKRDCTELIYQLFDSPCQAMVRRVASILLCVVSPKIIAELIVEISTRDVECEVMKFANPRAPQISKIQLILLQLLLELKRKQCDDLVTNFLYYAEKTIQSAKTMAVLSPIARLHLSFLKSGQDFSRMKAMMYIALANMKVLAVPYIYIVFTCWPDVFTNFQTLEGHHKLIARGFMALINLFETPQSLSLRNILSSGYGYSMDVEKLESLLDELLQHYTRTKEEQLKAMVLIIGKNVPSKVFFKQIGITLKPLISNETSSCSALHLLRFLLCELSYNDDMEQIVTEHRNWLIIFSKGDLPQTIKQECLTTIEALLKL